ncbi:MAG: alpha-amylase family glycosyl hydrolase [Bacteroidota bacterium]
MRFPLIVFLCVVVTCCFTKQNSIGQVQLQIPSMPEEEIIYHVFQRSFYDSNEDGHGDLNGVTHKLDYLKELGVTSILMTPLYKSIYYHNYFADDFNTIDPEYGTLEDYFTMVRTIHDKGMKYYMDMEIHYVTQNHPWFGESVGNPESEYSNYVIYNGPHNTEPETMIFNLTKLDSYDGNSVNITTIDVENGKVKKEVYDLFKYWVDPNGDGKFEDGVDGFRIDHMMDDLDWKGIRTNMFESFWAPLFKELKVINPNIRVFGEQANWNDLGTDYFTKGGVDMMFAFAIREAFVASDKIKLIDKTDSTWMATPERGSQILFLENHDIARYASVVDQDPARLRLGAFFMLFSKGIPSIYYGQELGMTGAGGFGRFGVTDGNDIPMREAFEWYADNSGEGLALWYKDSGPWWDETNLKANDGISLEEQKDDPTSLFNFYKQIIKLRKSRPALAVGDQKFMSNNTNELVSYIRHYKGKAYLVAFNTSADPIKGRVEMTGLPNAVKYSSKTSIVISDGDTTIPKADQSSIDVSISGYGFGLWELE